MSREDIEPHLERVQPEGDWTPPYRRRSPRLAAREVTQSPRTSSGPAKSAEERARVTATVPDSASEREWVIDKRIRRGRDKEEKYWAFAKWYGYPAKHGTWKTKDALPPRLVARLAKSRPGYLVDLE